MLKFQGLKNVKIEDSNEVRPSGRQTSNVWSHFKQITINGKIKAECTYCKKNYVSGSEIGTRHLIDHLKTSVKKKKNHDIKQCTLASTQDPSSKVTTMSTYHFNQDDSQRNLV